MDSGILRVSTERGERTYVLGTRTQPDATPPVIDWRMAPLAEAFFRSAPGEPYELEAGQEGKVLERWIVDHGTDGERKIGDTVIRYADGREETRPRPAPVKIPQPDRTGIIVLDPEQQKAVDLP